MACKTSIPSPSPNNQCDCINPLDFIFDLAEKNTTEGLNLVIVLDAILDKGYVTTNCGNCCPGCSGMWSLASVETMLKLYEGVGLIDSAIDALSPYGSSLLESGMQFTDFNCCANVKASVETYIKYAEALGLTDTTVGPVALKSSSQLVAPGLVTCCNNFEECYEGLLCLINDSVRSNSQYFQAVDRILDKGIVEYGQLSSCTSISGLCKLVDIFLKFNNEYGINWWGSSSIAEVIDRILDKGLVVSCDETGRFVVASTETWLKYGEAMGYAQSAAVPVALPNTTSTTTTGI